MSRPSRSPRLWLPVSCFLAVSLLVPLTCRWRQKATRPRTLADLVARAESQLHLHPVAVTQTGDVRSGVYLCRDANRTRENLMLPRNPAFLDEWRGVVLVQRAPLHDPSLSDMLDDWGTAGALLGDVLLFGDPALIAEIVHMDDERLKS